MLEALHAAEPLFHTGWFVESLATQTLVLFIIRTSGNPLRSRPSLPLTITVLTIVALGLILPFTPLAGPLRFVPLPGLYFLFLAGGGVDLSPARRGGQASFDETLVGCGDDVKKKHAISLYGSA